MNHLREMFLDSLADMYFAEKQLTKALPKMAKAARHEDLREAFESHLEETQGHVQKVEQVFAALGEKAKSKKCPAILGIIEEAEEMISENKKKPTLDAALVFAAQKAEHYEISSYGGLVAWATELGENKAASILKGILGEEKAADEKLTDLAEGCCNQEADTSKDEEMAGAGRK